MKRLLASSLATLFLSPAYGLAQCQAGASKLQSLGVCSSHGDWTYEDLQVSTPVGTANVSCWSPVHVTVTIPFYPSGNVALNTYNLGRFQLVVQANGTADFYDSGVFVMNISQATIPQFQSYMLARWPSAQQLSWITDLKYAFYGGSYQASSDCNQATLVAAAAAATFFYSIYGSQLMMWTALVGLGDALGKERTACG